MVGFFPRNLITERMFFCRVCKRCVGVIDNIHLIRDRSTPSSVSVFVMSGEIGSSEGECLGSFSFINVLEVSKIKREIVHY